MRKKKTDLSGSIYTMLLAADMPMTNSELAKSLTSCAANVNTSIKTIKSWPSVRIETVNIGGIFYHTLMTDKPLAEVVPVTVESIIMGILRGATKPLSHDDIVELSGVENLKRKSVGWVIHNIKKNKLARIETTFIGRVSYHRLLKDGEELAPVVEKVKKVKPEVKLASAVNMIFSNQAAKACKHHRYIQESMQ